MRTGNYERIILEFNDSIAILTLNHPEVLNSISTQMTTEMKDALDRTEHLENIRCLLIAGAGRGFCAGHNLNGSKESKKRAPDQKYLEDYATLFLKLKNLRMPFIAAVKGPVVGIGMSLALSADLVLAGRSTYFLQGFSRIGLIPDGGASYILPRMIGKARAMELSLLTERLPVEKALEWGLINRLFEDDQLMPEAIKMAKQLAAGPTVAFSLTRKAYWQSFENTYEQHFDLEAKFIKELSRSEDRNEGVLAFLEKRRPLFKGK